MQANRRSRNGVKSSAANAIASRCSVTGRPRRIGATSDGRPDDERRPVIVDNQAGGAITKAAQLFRQATKEAPR
jgi:hypothetical protein